jgi:RNA polymerase sigma-70 factor (ECF subfamily)
VYRRAFVLLKDEEESRDAMQEVFVKVASQHETFRGDAPILRWLYRITTNLCLNRLRQRRTHPVVSDPEAVSNLIEDRNVDLVDRQTVVSLLSRFDIVTQQIVVYYYVDEMRMDEVADMVGYSRKTVGKKLDRFRKRARALLSPPDERLEAEG